MMDGTESIDAAYNRGYENGENSCWADWIGALGEVLPAGMEITPSSVAAYILNIKTPNGCTHGDACVCFMGEDA